MSGKLIVCPTPIGNLQDITLRVLAALREADVIACEDTRHTSKLLRNYGVSAKLVSYYEQNERSRSAELVRRIHEGLTIALVSDAGTPLVSDPGFVLMRAVIAAGLAVEVLPGPSAALTALVASGLPGDRWSFLGFLPRKAGDLAQLLSVPETLVAFESPHRLAASLRQLADADPGREVAVCRELTKLHEEVVRGTAIELAQRYSAAEPRGEIVVVIGPASDSDADEMRPALAAVRRLSEAGAKKRVAASVVAELTGTSANALYNALTQEPSADSG